MPSYLSLIEFTEKGLREINQSVQRATNFRNSVEAAGGSVKELYWAVGEADGVVLFEAPDADTASALLLRLAREGCVRTRTLRVFPAVEFEKILEKV